MQAIVGVLLFVALAYLLSENRRGVAWRAVAFGIGLQFVLAVVLLKIPVVSQVLFGLNQFVVAIEAATTAGTVFLFGYLGGGELPFNISAADAPYLLLFESCLR